MSYGNEKDLFVTDYARGLISFKASQLSPQVHCSQEDPEDIEQDLWLAVLGKSPGFDSGRSSVDTYVDRVVDTAVKMKLRDRRRQKRGNGKCPVSLDAPARGAKKPRSRELPESQLTARLGYASANETDRRETTQAVEHALKAMPPELSSVVRRVMGGTISSAARELGTSRRQVRHAIERALPYFRRAGLN